MVKNLAIGFKPSGTLMGSLAFNTLCAILSNLLASFHFFKVESRCLPFKPAKASSLVINILEESGLVSGLAPDDLCSDNNALKYLDLL